MIPVAVNVEKERGVQTFYRRRSTATGMIRAGIEWTKKYHQIVNLPKLAQFPDASGKARTHSSKLVAGAGVSGSSPLVGSLESGSPSRLGLVSVARTFEVVQRVASWTPTQG